MDRADVVRGLECRFENKPGKDCEHCHYGTTLGRRWGCDFMRMCGDAIALLKAQEPRVLTLGELRECVTYWIEDETGHVVPETIMDITGKDIMTIPVVHLTNGYAPIITKTTDGYNSKRFTGWRCWTSRPTDEQREATPWE